MNFEDVSRSSWERLIALRAEHVWIIDRHVAICGEWQSFFRSFKENKADFLSTSLRYRYQDRGWFGWRGFKMENEGGARDRDYDVASFSPICRLSAEAVHRLLAASDEGVVGCLDVVLPSVIQAAGLKLEDVGGHGAFTPEARRRKWYSDRSMAHSGYSHFEEGALHFPVLRKGLHVPRDRKRPDLSRRRTLLFAGIGSRSSEFLSATVPLFEEAGADILLVQYEDCRVPGSLMRYVRRAKGGKWQLAKEFLAEDVAWNYDYVFCWDDDLRPVSMDVNEFIEVMRDNCLDVAQPAVSSLHPLSHPIVGRCELPLIDSSVELVGRLTNFVEVMAPCYSARAWALLLRVLDERNFSGWGYDAYQLGRMGVVDKFEVEHLYPVSSLSEDAFREKRRFLKTRGVFSLRPAALGWLLRERDDAQLVHFDGCLRSESSGFVVIGWDDVVA